MVTILKVLVSDQELSFKYTFDGSQSSESASNLCQCVSALAFYISISKYKHFYEYCVTVKGTYVQKNDHVQQSLHIKQFFLLFTKIFSKKFKYNSEASTSDRKHTDVSLPLSGLNLSIFIRQRESAPQNPTDNNIFPISCRLSSAFIYCFSLSSFASFNPLWQEVSLCKYYIQNTQFLITENGVIYYELALYLRSYTFFNFKTFENNCM